MVAREKGREQRKQIKKSKKKELPIKFYTVFYLGVRPLVSGI